MTTRVVFIDRDGTLIREPEDQQVDSVDKVQLVADVIPALLQLKGWGYRLVMVTNQDGLGTESFPQSSFDAAHAMVMQLFSSQGIAFDEVFICPHLPADGCECRKPKTGLLIRYLAGTAIDLEASAVVGDRDTDLELAERLGVRGFRLREGGSFEESWFGICQALRPGARRAKVTRTTRETDIVVEVDLDSDGPASVSTGIGFFDHMLEQVSKHGGFQLTVRCDGDLEVDEHHTVEDTALALGAALRQALGDKRGIGRYGFVLPMDETEAKASVDLSGRPYAVFDGTFAAERVGGLPTELVPHFFQSLADAMGAALHIAVTGENSHHKVEACFKAAGRCLRQALRREGDELPSTKGVL